MKRLAALLDPLFWLVVVFLASFLLGGCHGAYLQAPDGVVAHVASRHLGGPPPGTDDLGATVGREDLNETNPGAGLDWAFRDYRLETGAFVNSFGDLAPYVAGHWVGFQTDDFEGGLTAGLALYDDPSDSPLVPMVGPWVAVRVGRVWARVLVAPGLDSNVLLAFSFRVPLGAQR